MAASVEASSPSSFCKGSPSLNDCSSPPMFSPPSNERFWNTLRSRVDALLENRKLDERSLPPAQSNAESEGRSRRMKEDSMLLLRGFDSVAQTLSQLSNNLENALQGARDLATPPTMTDLVQAALNQAKTDEENQLKEGNQYKEEDNEVDKRGMKRKLDSEQVEDDGPLEKGKCPDDMRKIQKAKNMAISMATRAATMARELKSVRSDLSFMQGRCAVLEEENRKLRDGLGNGIQPDEDDLVRLQLEALLAEKSRLANENANLKRENQCLHQLVDYHQMTSQDLSASYENLVKEMGLEFCSPDGEGGSYKTPCTHLSEFSKSLDEYFDED
ncbi:uncharacterized protein LOC127258800 [Andrographis paniculata]|uniref:uncharacterized protein LOC127258800 n=1 Tax=Andrographis paniculata TaxID=175694 RepID=UPI0021E88335|nr:uncharacterized protein LOC127258800 [Andrographis paniculata]